jgi:hypothetical protein
MNGESQPPEKTPALDPREAEFRSKARRASLNEFVGRGFLQVRQGDLFKRLHGEVRLPLAALNPIALNFPARGPEPVRGRYRGPVYDDDACVHEEHDVHVSGYSVSGDAVRVTLEEAPRRPRKRRGKGEPDTAHLRPET